MNEEVTGQAVIVAEMDDEGRTVSASYEPSKDGPTVQASVPIVFPDLP